MKPLSKSIFPSNNTFNKFLNDLSGGMPIEEIVDKHGVVLYYPLDLLQQIIETGEPVVSEKELKRLRDYRYQIVEAARMRRKLIKKEEKTDDTTD